MKEVKQCCYFCEVWYLLLLFLCCVCDCLLVFLWGVRLFAVVPARCTTVWSCSYVVYDCLLLFLCGLRLFAVVFVFQQHGGSAGGSHVQQQQQANLLSYNTTTTQQQNFHSRYWTTTMNSWTIHGLYRILGTMNTMLQISWSWFIPDSRHYEYRSANLPGVHELFSYMNCPTRVVTVCCLMGQHQPLTIFSGVA